MKTIPSALSIPCLKSEWARLIFREEKSFVFVDTNILLWIFRLNDLARSQFMLWFKGLADDDRLFFPAWVLHEYNNHLAQGNDEALFPFKRPGKEVLRRLPVIKKYANLLVDEGFLKGTEFESRDTLLSELSDAIESLSAIVRCLNSSQNVDKESIRSEIEPLLNERVLDTDIYKIINDIQSQAGIRFTHNIPPRFEDDGKKKNRYGDLIIWKEILEKCSKERATGAIFLTNDLKRDWVVKPDYLVLEEGDKRRIPNNTRSIRYYIPSPQLVHEFQLHTGSSDFHIIDMEFLSNLLFSLEYNPLNYSQFEQLALAVQVDSEISPTQQVVQWFAKNRSEYENALKGVCRWYYDPSEVDIDKLHEWATERIQNINLDLVNWTDVFCELFL
jgi:predicted nucleic-acid-binding protein